jgi:hypothetical protein
VGPARQLPQATKEARSRDTSRWLVGPVVLGRFTCGEKKEKEKREGGQLGLGLRWPVGWWPIRGVRG